MCPGARYYAGNASAPDAAPSPRRSQVALAEKRTVFSSGKMVQVSRTEGAKDLDLVQSLELDELIKPQGEDFAPTMIASLKERVAKVEESVKVIAVGMDTMPEDGDFDGLRHAMDCIYQVKTRTDEIEYELDVLLALYPILLFNKAYGRFKKDYQVIRAVNWGLFLGVIASGAYGSFQGLKLMGV